MKILVTGATSFIGSTFINGIKSENCEIITVVRKDSKKLKNFKDSSNIKIVELNMEEYHKLGNYVNNIDCIVHLAWNGTRGLSRNDENLQRSNFEYSVELFEEGVKLGCKKIITAGSQAEYGLHKSIITEETVCKPNTQYGIYKYKLYKKVVEICEKNGLSYVEPRFFSLYGKGDFQNTLIMSLIDKMSKDEKCELTECKQLWDFLYIKDAVSAMIGLCFSECENGVYNFGSGDVRELKNYIEELKSIMNSNSELVYGAVPYPSTGMVSIYPSVEKLKTKLNWKPKYRFKDGISEMIK